jgi:lipopolysaccharide biosynthesis regulator YciM
MTLKAALALRNGETQAALDLASAVLVEEPERENAVAVLVGAYHRLGETERALARLDEALAANAASVSLRLLKITLLNAETDDVEAILATYELIALQPTDVFSRLSLAAFLEGQDEVAGAASVLRQAIADGIAAPQVAEGLVRLVHEAEVSMPPRRNSRR